MKQEIIDKIRATISEHSEWKSALKDFEKYDKKSLENYEGDFVLVAYQYGTGLSKIDYAFSGFNKYAIDAISKNGLCLQCYYDKDAEWIIYINGELTQRTSHFWAVDNISDFYAEECNKKFHDMLEEMRNKQRFFIKCSDEYFMEAIKLALEHNDKTLGDCFKRMVNWTDNIIDSRIELYSDFTDNSFTFSQIDNETGKLIMNGGIIFHGFPDTGYAENGSVQMNKSYGWQIHT